MPNGVRCENCIEKCPQARMAHEIAVGRMYATNEFMELQKKIENGELVEVIRCRDCKFYQTFGHEDKPFCQKFFGLMIKPDNFCSYGEKSGTQPQREDV